MEIFLAKQERTIGLSLLRPTRNRFRTNVSPPARGDTSLLASTEFPSNIDLSMLDKEPIVDDKTAKDRLLCALTQNYAILHFKKHSTYLPGSCVATLDNNEGKRNQESCCTEVYYQTFPCLRIVQPRGFNLALAPIPTDVAYGYHPCSINGYVFLTEPHPRRICRWQRPRWKW